MHVSVVNFGTPMTVVGDAWDQREGYLFPTRHHHLNAGLMLQGYKHQNDHQNDPGVKCRSKERVQRQVMLNTGTSPVSP
jgi:hypothetical protein